MSLNKCPIPPPEILVKKGIRGAYDNIPEGMEVGGLGGAIFRALREEIMQHPDLVRRSEPDPIPEPVVEVPAEPEPKLSEDQRDELATALETISRLTRRNQ